MNSDYNKIAIAISVARETARKKGFYWFIDNIYRHSFPREPFVTGDYIKNVAARYEKYKHTIDVTGRGHFKSSRVHAEIMYLIFINNGTGFEGQYFSYSEKMAKYQLKKLKQEISANPFFSTVIDLKNTSESILAYKWNSGDQIMSVEPRGLLSSGRGIHCEMIFIDDPLKTEDTDSPGASPDPVSIRKINDIIRSDIIPMLKPNGLCRVVATPQTQYDFIFDTEGLGSKFDISITPAILDEVNHVTLWPELWPYERLEIERKTINDIDKFNREYMAQPASLSKSFIKQDNLLKISTATCLSYEPHPELEGEDIRAGFDIGKARHPSHLSIFKRSFLREGEDGNDIYRYDQIFDKWLDSWDYQRQVEYINVACEYFHISNLYFDNTRGELLAYEENGLLDKAIHGLGSGGRRKKTSVATNFQRLINNELISIVNEERTRTHILLVDSNLNSIEILKGPMRGHGDSFASMSMAVWEPERKIPKIYSLGGSSASELQTEKQPESRQEEINSWATAMPQKTRLFY